MAEYSINAKTTGILRDTHFLDKYNNNPDVLYAKPLVQVSKRHLMLLQDLAISMLPVIIV
jgi:hypothetical protein